MKKYKKPGSCIHCFHFIMFLALLMNVIPVYAQSRIQGTVTDVDGNPLIGASVVNQSNKNGDITNLNGTFSIEAKKEICLKSLI